MSNALCYWIFFYLNGLYRDLGTGEQKIFEIINKRAIKISIRGVGNGRKGWEKIQKSTSGVGTFIWNSGGVE